MPSRETTGSSEREEDIVRAAIPHGVVSGVVMGLLLRQVRVKAKVERALKCLAQCDLFLRD